MVGIVSMTKGRNPINSSKYKGREVAMNRGTKERGRIAHTKTKRGKKLNKG